MEQVQQLIAAFHNQQQNKKNEYPGKMTIIRSLEERDTPEVLTFFLQTVANPQEYDLARMEILKILRLYKSDEQQRQNIAQVLVTIVKEDQDDLVRSYAIMALRNYTGIEQVDDVVERVVTDEDEDEDLRFNAFSVLERIGPNERTRRLLQDLAEDEVLGSAVKRVRKTWNV